MHHALPKFGQSVDEISRRQCNRIDVTFTTPSLSDNGRGPVDMHPEYKIQCGLVLTTLHSGGKYGSGYTFSGGTHGAAQCVNAVSKWFSVEFSARARSITWIRARENHQELEVIGKPRDGR